MHSRGFFLSFSAALLAQVGAYLLSGKELRCCTILEPPYIFEDTSRPVSFTKFNLIDFINTSSSNVQAVWF